MVTSSSKSNSQLLFKSLIFAITSSLLLSFINPTMAKANTVDPPPPPQSMSAELVSTPKLDFAPINLEIEKSHNDLGDSRDPFVTVKRKPDTTWPAGATTINLYDLDTGLWLDTKGIDSNFSGTEELEITKFADKGVHNYQVTLTTRSPNFWYPPEHIAHFEGEILGKSNILQFERERTIDIALSSEIYGSGNSTWSYEMNQEINGNDYFIHLYNVDTGEAAFRTGAQSAKEGILGFTGPEPGSRAYNFKAILIESSILNWSQEEENYLAKYDEIIHQTAAISNTVMFERLPWSVKITDYADENYPPIDGSGIKVNTNRGGGQFIEYVVENSTNKIIWHRHDPILDYMIDMKGNSDVSWVTAYIALDYTTYNYEYPKPETLSDLKEVIASSDGKIIERGSGVINGDEISGGKSNSEKCNLRCVGDPINTATGEFFEKKIDISTVGSGLIPNVERSFSTMNKDVLKTLGNGWRTNYDMKLFSGGDTESSDYDPNIFTSKSIKIENENSSVTTFLKNNDGTYIAEKSNTLASLKFDAISQTFQYERMISKETFTFDNTGKLVQISNDKDQKVNLTYNSTNQLVMASDLVGNTLTFAYHSTGNEVGLISSITSQNGETSTYSYNSNKQLISVRSSKNLESDYTYDDLNRIVSLTNELGGVFTNTYDNRWDNRVVKQIDPLGREIEISYSGDLTKGETTITHSNSKITKEFYHRGQLIKKIDNFSTSEELIWHYSYDTTGSLISTVNPDLTSSDARYDERGNQIEFTDESKNTTSFSYDSNDNLIRVKDPLGFETVNTYDSKNNLTSTTTPLGEKTTFTYTANSQIASVTDARGNAVNSNSADFTSSFSYLPNNLLSESNDSLAGITKASYDNKGQLISTIDAKNNESKIAYNNLGLPSTIIDPLQNETALTYDQMGNVLTSKNSENAITSYTYDSVGNMLTTTNALNETTTYVYNNMDKPVTITLADGTVQSIKYDIFDRPIEMTDQLGRITKQEFDKNSNLIASIDAEGSRTEYTYTRDGRLESIKDPVGSITQYSYDKAGQLVSITDPISLVTKTVYDGNGRVIESIAADNTSMKTFYDSVGNIIKTTNEAGKSKNYTYDSLNRQVSYTNETGQITSYSYDKNSNLISQTRPNASIVFYTYDSRNLLTKVDYPGSSEDIVYVYDSLGRKTSETKGSQVPTVYTYDSLNRLKSQGKTGAVVSYDYGISGNLTKTTYPSGRAVDYDYDAAGQVTQLDTAGIIGLTLGYNKRGQEITAVLPSAVTESKNYDASGRFTGSELKNSSETSIYKRTQQYNLANEVTQKGVYSNGQTISLDNFIYDPTYRLTEQMKDSDGSSVNGYNYNAVGNLSAINIAAQSHDDAGKITSSGSSTIFYDDRNNRVATVNTSDAKKNTEYVWAQDNLLKEITTHKDASATTTEYEYGAGSLLEKRTQGSDTTNFVWDTNREIPLMLSDGKFEYIYKTAEDRIPFAQIDIQTQIVTYLHSDLTGSIVATTESNGALIGKTDYSPYGAPTGAALSRFGYAGEWTDETTGYSYLRARWLDVSTGSFLSEDPLVQMTQNAFGYTEGNPLTQIDPLGLFSFGDWVYKNSSSISLGLTTVAIIASATGVGAPLGALATGLAVGASGYSAYRSAKDGDKAGAVINGIGAIPGIGWFGATIRVAKINETSIKLVTQGSLSLRKESLGLSRNSRQFRNGFDNSGIGLSILGSIDGTFKGLMPITKQTAKGASECA